MNYLRKAFKMQMSPNILASRRRNQLAWKREDEQTKASITKSYA